MSKFFYGLLIVAVSLTLSDCKRRRSPDTSVKEVDLSKIQIIGLDRVFKAGETVDLTINFLQNTSVVKAMVFLLYKDGGAAKHIARREFRPLNSHSVVLKLQLPRQYNFKAQPFIDITFEEQNGGWATKRIPIVLVDAPPSIQPGEAEHTNGEALRIEGGQFDQNPPLIDSFRMTAKPSQDASGKVDPSKQILHLDFLVKGETDVALVDAVIMNGSDVVDSAGVDCLPPRDLVQSCSIDIGPMPKEVAASQFYLKMVVEDSALNQTELTRDLLADGFWKVTKSDTQISEVNLRSKTGKLEIQIVARGSDFLQRGLASIVYPGVSSSGLTYKGLECSELTCSCLLDLPLALGPKGIDDARLEIHAQTVSGKRLLKRIDVRGNKVLEDLFRNVPINGNAAVDSVTIGR